MHKWSSPILIFLLASCTATYTPATLVPHSFERSQDLSISSTVGVDGGFANVAYSPVKHIYLQGSGTFLRKRKSANSLFSDQQFHKSGLLGLGAYFTIKKKYLIDLQYNYGEGSFNHNFTNSGSSFWNSGTGNYYVGDMSASFSWKVSNKFQHGVSLRFGYAGTKYSWVGSPFDLFINYNEIYRSTQQGASYYMKFKHSSGFSLFASAGIFWAEGRWILMNAPTVRFGFTYRIRGAFDQGEIE
ncbi:MAG: hypothetical protein ACI9J3_002861 [Parvicellaceae bacterium]|jgi:hypothetical protein